MTFREFTAAVEQKQVAQQEAEKARFLVERAEFYKKAAVIQVTYDLLEYSNTDNLGENSHIYKNLV